MVGAGTGSALSPTSMIGMVDRYIETSLRELLELESMSRMEIPK